MIDDERTTLAERYMTATTSTSLKVVTESTMSATDILAAAGMAGHKHDLAVQLWALRHSPTHQNIHRAIEKLLPRLDDYMMHKRLEGRSRRIVFSVMHWHLDKTCASCGGHGKERIGGTPHLSDTPCPACHGTGERKLQTENDEAARWLLDEIKALSSSAEMAIRRKIK